MVRRANWSLNLTFGMMWNTRGVRCFCSVNMFGLWGKITAKAGLPALYCTCYGNTTNPRMLCSIRTTRSLKRIIIIITSLVYYCIFKCLISSWKKRLQLKLLKGLWFLSTFYLFWCVFQFEIWFCTCAILHYLLHCIKLCLFHVQVEANLVWVHMKRLAVLSINITVGPRLCPSHSETNKSHKPFPRSWNSWRKVVFVGTPIGPDGALWCISRCAN